MKRIRSIIIVLVVLLSTGCVDKAPVKVGFSAQLTGKQAELGIQQRNGVMMALDEINDSGGVEGRKIELIVKDDLGTPEGAVAADTELINQKVVCIIGHATSSLTIAALPISQKSNMILMSPTTSTAELSGKDDNFFRIIQSLIDRANGLATYMKNDSNINHLGVIYDTANEAYVRSFWNVFSKKYIELGGVVVAEKQFSSLDEETNFDQLLLEMKEQGVEGVLIIASDTDAALIAQRTRIMGWDVPFFSSAWAQTEELIKNGGKAVEGMILEQSFSLESTEPKYLEFKKKFTERFGKEPSFAAVFGYETMLTLKSALEKSGGEAAGLKEALLKVKNFKGLVDMFSIDQYGDVIRPYYLGIVKDGQFEDLNSFTPE